jgi:hypothetical protein
VLLPSEPRLLRLVRAEGINAVGPNGKGFVDDAGGSLVGEQSGLWWLRIPLIQTRARVGGPTPAPSAPGTGAPAATRRRARSAADCQRRTRHHVAIAAGARTLHTGSGAPSKPGG